MLPEKSHGNPLIKREDIEDYYRHHFPVELICKWLSHNESSRIYFEHREFSFILENDIYCRYLSFERAEDLKRELLKKIPLKVDIGAIYTLKPKERNNCGSALFIPVEREVVLDIDLSDYNELRMCCQEKEICALCWSFVAFAIRFLDETLRVDFGFQEILWVYSGRRGVHCWVSDKRARNLKSEGREAFAHYLNTFGPTDNNDVSTLFENPVHPFIQRLLDHARKDFERIILEEQRLLNHEAGRRLLLSWIRDERLKGEVARIWEGERKPLEMWREMEKLVEKDIKKKRHFSKNKNLLAEIMVRCLFPRIDLAVTEHAGHLLKAPFSIHPKTAAVSIPLKLEEADGFNPSNVVTLPELVSGEEKALQQMEECTKYFSSLIVERKHKIMDW